MKRISWLALIGKGTSSAQRQWVGGVVVALVAMMSLIAIPPQPASADGSGSITGRVINDITFENPVPAGDPGAPGLTVYAVVHGDSTTFDLADPHATTSSTGAYTLSPVVDGTYDVLIVPDPDNSFGEPVVEPPSSVAVSGATINVADAAVSFNGGISGTISDDINNNHVVDAGEPPAVDATVYLDANHNGVFDTGEQSTPTGTSGDNEGKYQLLSVPPGAHDEVRVTAPDAVSTLNPGGGTVTVASTEVTAQDGAIKYGGSISGTVYNDKNGNNTPDAGEGVGGVTIDREEDSINETVAVTTPADGTYMFSSVPNGTTFSVFPDVSAGASTDPVTSHPTITAGSHVTGNNFRIMSEATSAPDAAEGNVTAGDTLETSDPPSAADPLQVGVTSGATGPISIVESKTATSPAPSGFTLLPLEVTVDAPPTTPGSPHLLEFKIDASILTSTGLTIGQALDRFVVLRAGDIVDSCTSATDADPDPCIASGTFDGSVLEFVVRTSTSQFSGPTLNASALHSKAFHANAAQTGVWDFALSDSSSGADGSGYYVAGSDGGVFAYGDAPFYGSHGGQALNAPIVGMATLPDGSGYYLVASDGGVFAYGDAPFYGSHGGKALNAPIVGMATLPDGSGYYLVASDGGVFAYGDAPYYGSLGGQELNAPVAAISALPDGSGYYLTAKDGGVFAYGDAQFHGSHSGHVLNDPIVGISALPDGSGYYLVASDGGVFAYGDAPFYGSHGGQALNSPVVGITALPDGSGYYLDARDGGVFAYGAAPFHGSRGGQALNGPIVGGDAV